MAVRLVFNQKAEFIEELRSLLAKGIDPQRLRVRTPYHVHEAEELLFDRPGNLRYFALFGALGGFGGGFALAALTSLDWPIVTGGKPIVSVPPFLLIGYLMTILFGSLISFVGFLLLTRLPNTRVLEEKDEFEEQFVIILQDEVSS
ncbi:MAG: quinol:electron acceptor oxidoreductase subunit ActD [Syntrophotaleaceae bacterium]